MKNHRLQEFPLKFVIVININTPHQKVTSKRTEQLGELNLCNRNNTTPLAYGVLIHQNKAAVKTP